MGAGECSKNEGFNKLGGNAREGHSEVREKLTVILTGRRYKQIDAEQNKSTVVNSCTTYLKAHSICNKILQIATYVHDLTAIIELWMQGNENWMLIFQFIPSSKDQTKGKIR